MITVVVQLKESSQPIIYEDVMNTYQKGDFFVIHLKDGKAFNKAFKHPIATIWRVIEEYGYHGTEGK